MATIPDHQLRAVVVLAGGGSKRLGRDKLAVGVGGATVLDRLLDGLAAAVPGVPVRAVGPPRTTSHLVAWCREEPAGGGPVAGLACGLTSALADSGTADRTTSGLVAVLAGDLPFGADALPALLAAVRADPPVDGADAWLAVDIDGVRQPLLGLYRIAALTDALAGDCAGRSMRALLAGLRVRTVVVPSHSTLDVDTEDDLAAVRAHLGGAGEHPAP